MTQENEELLIEDLSCRIPYGVIVNVEGLSNVKLESVNWYYEVKVDDGSSTDLYPISEVRPYLRPMSSMTKEEKIDYDRLCSYCLEQDTVNYNITTLDRTQLVYVINWLNKNHFDYRGLIEKGLAIEAPEGMYNF